MLAGILLFFWQFQLDMENPAQLKTLRHCFRTRPVRRNEAFWWRVAYAVTVTCAQERLCLPLCLLSFLYLKKAGASVVFSFGHSALSVPIIAQSHSQSLGEGTVSSSQGTWPWHNGDGAATHIMNGTWLSLALFPSCLCSWHKALVPLVPLCGMGM